MKNRSLPQYAQCLLVAICPDWLLEEIEGDLTQRYNRNIRFYGVRKARIKLFFNVITYLRPGIIFRNKLSNPLNEVPMLKNYFLIARRNLLRHRSNTLINMLSLIVGVSSAFIIYKILNFEQSFDKFHSKSEQTYRVVRVTKGDDPKERRAGISYPLPQALKEELKQIDDITSLEFVERAQVDILNEKNAVTKKFDERGIIALTDTSFFKIFDFNNTDFRWIEGDSKSALAEPFSAVLTKSLAEKYFGKQSPLGLTIRVDKQNVFTITGLTEDLPQNSDFPFKLFLSYATVDKLKGGKPNDDWWSVSDDFQCFVTILRGASVAEINADILRVHASKVPKDLAENRIYKLQPLADVHTESTFGNFKQRTVSVNTLAVLSFACLVLLLVGCINFINLSTAQSSLRAREVGVRKVLGGRRAQLFTQFLTETFIVVTISCVIGLFAAELFMRSFPELINYQVEQTLFKDPASLKFLGAVILGLTIVAGFYPSLVMSGFNPLSAIKNMADDGKENAALLRRTLVVVQFTLTQIFIISAFIVSGQMSFFKSKDLGFDKEAVLNVSLPEWEPGQLQTFKDKLEGNSLFSEVSFSLSSPSGLERPKWYTEIKRKGSDQGYIFEYQAIDPNYIPLYKMQIAAGRNFHPGDTVRGIIINETFVKNAGFTSPADAIGQTFILTNGPNLTVIGVVKDFHTGSLREQQDNLVFVMQPNHFRTASIKLSAPPSTLSFEEMKRAISYVEQVWSATYPTSVFEYNFLDNNIAAFYKNENKLAVLSKISSVVFLLIGCLGLYGLISFVIDRKMKEVAVRKVLGASMSAIVQLISRDYVRLILISFFIAAPVAYYFMNQWLTNFEYRITISWILLVLPCALVLVVAGVSVLGKLLKAANINPAEVLKHE